MLKKYFPESAGARIGILVYSKPLSINFNYTTYPFNLYRYRKYKQTVLLKYLLTKLQFKCSSLINIHQRNINSNHKSQKSVSRQVHGRAEECVGGDEAVGQPPHDQRL